MARNLDEAAEDVLAARKVPKTQWYPTVAEFYDGRSIFVTGGSGFVGRVLIEELLRICPGIDKIYMLIRPKRGATAEERLRVLLDVPLFDRLREEQPNALEKIIPMKGDCSQLSLGLSPEDIDILKKNVSVVFHGAASVRFDDPIKKAVLLNLRGTREIVDIARSMNNLVALVHISTAYTFTDHEVTNEKVYPTFQDWRTIIRVAETIPDERTLDLLGSRLLGFQPNAYTFTKALAEHVINEASDSLPIVIIRPSIVTSAVSDPMPGWVDNLNGFAAFWVGGFKGIIRANHVDPDTEANFVSVDVVVKNSILCSWITGTGRRLNPAEKTDVVTIGSLRKVTYRMMQNNMPSILNATAYPGAIRYGYTFFVKHWIVYFALHVYFQLFFGALLDIVLRLSGNKPRVIKIYRKYIAAMDALDYFRTRSFLFETNNLWRAQSAILPSDEPEFDVLQFRKAECLQLMINEVRGILRYTLREKDDIKENKKLAYRLLAAEMVFHTLFFGLVFWIIRLIFFSR